MRWWLGIVLMLLLAWPVRAQNPWARDGVLLLAQSGSWTVRDRAAFDRGCDIWNTLAMRPVLVTVQTPEPDVWVIPVEDYPVWSDVLGVVYYSYRPKLMSFRHGPDMDEVDLIKTVTHELGHVLGLDHSPDPRSIMFAGLGRLDQVPREADVKNVWRLWSLESSLEDDGATASVRVGKRCLYRRAP